MRLRIGRGHRRLLRLALVAPILILLAACEERLSTLHPAGPAAEAIALIWWVMIAGATLILAFVMVLLWLAFRARPHAPPHAPPDEARRRGEERVWIWGLGLAFSLTVLGALLAFGLVVGERLLPRPGPEVVTVRAEASWQGWRFGYADAPGRVTAGILHVPAGRPVDVELTAAEVIHAFWVPRLAGKLDAIPGHVNVLRIEADAPGDYAGLDGEYSGPGYRLSGFTLRAHDAAGWDAFLGGAEP